MRNRVTAAILCAVAAALFCLPIHASDVPINPTGPVYRIANQTLGWGISGGGGVNNNFFFSPIAVNEYVCTYLYNNNPTSAHPVAVNIVTNANALNISPSDATWQNVNGGNFTPIKAFPSIPGVYGAYVSGAALVSINISASTTQAGSPDTANVIIIQTQSPCANVSGVQTNGAAALSAIPPVLAQSDTNGNAFIVQGAQTNPAGNPALLVASTVANGNQKIYFDRAVISCTAVCPVTLAFTNGTCTGSADAIQNQNGNTSGLSTSTATQNCSTNPANNPVSIVNIAANTPYTLDMKGMTAPANTSIGYFVASTFTGTINVTMSWWEK